ncbi:Aste57867_5087 [Aphanomyces stellatus]|uniref:Conserved oligomeric Golgi complex subunit 5 n=1 Tax=Aphanomyces stellatus TaxID=120398 RepID=A0A485KCY2_9STRA|nr:hypothetical protein As57867_005074 [Aphanomyces stellatus]VFT82168.1 Aste57867_5087 [Aphanomyces stellatus]
MPLKLTKATILSHRIASSERRRYGGRRGQVERRWQASPQPEVNVAQIASAIIAQDATATASASEDFTHKLAVAIKSIDGAIEGYIGASHTQLLNQVGSIDSLKTKVTQLHAQVTDVQGAIQRMDTDIHKAHRALQRTVQQLRNVDLCTVVLQKVLRFQSLVETLAALSLPTDDAEASANDDANYLTASTTLREAELIVEHEHVAFQALAVVAPALPQLRTWRTDIVKRMKTLLRHGMTSMDQMSIGRALQILYRLGAATLSEYVQAAVNGVLQDVETQCTDCLRESTLDESSLKRDVWAACQTVLDTLSAHALQVWNLERVLFKATVPGAGGGTYHALVLAADEPTLFATFWDISCALVRDLVAQTLDYRATVKHVFISNYPKLRVEATALLLHLHATTARLDTRAVCGTTAEKTQLLDAFAPLLDAFQDRSTKRMATPIQMMFPTASANYHASPPSRADMHTLLKIMQQELDVAGSDVVFQRVILIGVQHAVDLFCKSVAGMAHASVALPPTGPPTRTPTQAHNVALVTVCAQLDDALVAWRRPELNAARDRVHALAVQLLGRYLQVLAAKLEAIVASMHDETFADASSSPSGSRFMAEFAAAFAVVETDHLHRLGLDTATSTVRATCVDELTTRVLSAFARHVALVRPLGEAGKLRLAGDMAQLEMLLGGLVPSLKGLALEEFRAMRHLLFVETAAVCRDPKLDKIRPSNVWHHLLGRGPVALQSPHAAKGWTPAAYVAWMETKAGLDLYSPPLLPSDMPLGILCWKDRTLAMAAEQAIWKEIRTCLDAYVQRASAAKPAGKSGGVHQGEAGVYDILVGDGPTLMAGYEMATKAYLYPTHA